MKKNFTVTVDVDATDELVVAVLQDAYDCEARCPIEPDKAVLDALEVVLSYFMTMDEFEDWKESKR